MKDSRPRIKNKEGRRRRLGSWWRWIRRWEEQRGVDALARPKDKRATESQRNWRQGVQRADTSERFAGSRERLGAVEQQERQAIPVEVKGTTQNLSQQHAEANARLCTFTTSVDCMRQPARRRYEAESGSLCLDLRQDWRPGTRCDGGYQLAAASLKRRRDQLLMAKRKRPRPRWEIAITERYASPGRTRDWIFCCVPQPRCSQQRLLDTTAALAYETEPLTFRCLSAETKQSPSTSVRATSRAAQTEAGVSLFTRHNCRQKELSRHIHHQCVVATLAICRSAPGVLLDGCK